MLPACVYEADRPASLASAICFGDRHCTQRTIVLFRKQTRLFLGHCRTQFPITLGRTTPGNPAKQGFQKGNRQFGFEFLSLDDSWYLRLKEYRLGGCNNCSTRTTIGHARKPANSPHESKVAHIPLPLRRSFRTAHIAKW